MRQPYMLCGKRQDVHVPTWATINNTKCIHERTTTKLAAPVRGAQIIVTVEAHGSYTALLTRMHAHAAATHVAEQVHVAFKGKQ